MEDYTEFKQALQKLSKDMESKCEDVSLVKSTISGINNMVDVLIGMANCKQSKVTCPPGKLVNPKTGRCITKPKTLKKDKSKKPPVSKYYQKQYEKYMKPSDKGDIQEAFFEKVVEKPTKKHSYNLRGV